MSSIFTKIINRELPSYIVAEDEFNIAFLDINPLQKGHTLVVPKIEVDYIFDLDTQSYNKFFDFAKKVALAIDKVVECKRVGLAVIGLEVPHAHIHLIPINKVNDMNFSNKKIPMSESEFIQTAKAIKEAF